MLYAVGLIKHTFAAKIFTANELSNDNRIGIFFFKLFRFSKEMTGLDGNLFRKSVTCSSYQVQTCSPEVNHIINPPLTLIDDNCTVVILVMAIISSHLRNIYNS